MLAASGCGTKHRRRGPRTSPLQRKMRRLSHDGAGRAPPPKIGPNLDSAFAAAREAGEGGETIEGIVENQVEFRHGPSNGDPSVSMPSPTWSRARTSMTSPPTSACTPAVPGAVPHGPRRPRRPGLRQQRLRHLPPAGRRGSPGGTTGPDLDEVLPGHRPAMIQESIEDPNAKIAKGYPSNVMPPDLLRNSLSPPRKSNSWSNT